MNPDRIYTQYRDDALAKQITSDAYDIFVAMPFKERYSYPSRKIFEEVIRASVLKANSTLGKRKLSRPIRVDDEPGTSGVITEDIIVGILECHIFLADITFQNPGVLLEVGLALGLKPNKQIILITQDDLNTLHFNIRNNRVIQYNDCDPIDDIASALVSSVESYEGDTESYIKSVKRTLSPDAICCLRFYRGLQDMYPGKGCSLHAGVADKCFTANSGNRFNEATRELLVRKLIWTDYATNVVNNGKGDRFGMHPTEFGKVLIENMWGNIKHAPKKARPLWRVSRTRPNPYRWYSLIDSCKMSLL